MNRYPDWTKRLRVFCESKVSQPFSFGANDCCLFACDAVFEITGVDLAEGIRGYIGEAEADAVLAEHGGVEGVAAAMAERFGLQEIAPSFCQRGDVVLCSSEKPTLCIMDASGKPCGPGANGLAWYPRGLMRRAWRIG